MNSQKLYDGKYTITFKPNGRPRYKSEELGKDPNRLSPSTATGVIDKSKPMMIWATKSYRDFMLKNLNKSVFSKEEIELIIRDGVNKYQEISKDACDVGSFVHDWAENFAKAKMKNEDIPELPIKPKKIDENKWKKEIEPQVLSGIEGFIDWYKKNNVEFMEVERIIYSEKYNYWGRFDAIAKVNGKVMLIDYKTAKGVYLPFYLQTSAYWRAYEEENGKTFDGGLILHFQKDSEKAEESGTFHVYNIKRKDHEKFYLPSYVRALNLARINKAMDSYQKMTIDELKLTPYKNE